MAFQLRPERALPVRLGTVLFVLGLLLRLLGPVSSAHGAAGCRSDPLVTLDNGITLDLHAQIADVQSDVLHIYYVLHGPALSSTATPPSGAVTQDSGWYTVSYPDGTGPISHFRYVSDGTAHRYYATMYIVTSTAAVPVVAYLDWTAGGVHHSGTAQATGASGFPVTTSVLYVICGNQCTG